MYRIKIPSTVLNGGVIDFSGKADPEDEAFLATTLNRRKEVNTQVQTQPNWDRFLAGIPPGTSKAAVAQMLLSPALNRDLQAVVNRSSDVKAMVVELVSTPEYQLC